LIKFSLTNSEPAAFAFSPTANLLAVVHSRLLIRLYHLDETPSLHPHEIATFESPDPMLIGALVFSPDGRWLAGGAQDELIQLWDLQRIHEGLAALKLAKDFPAFGVAKPLSPTPTPSTTPASGTGFRLDSIEIPSQMRNTP
jgi:WD40 repeat protein